METETPPAMLRHFQWNLLQTHFDWIKENVFRKGKQETVDSPHYHATWVRRGKIRKYMGGQTIEVHSGEWIFQAPGKVSTTFYPDALYVEVGFSLKWVGEGLLQPPLRLLWKTDAIPELEHKSLCLYEQVKLRDVERKGGFRMQGRVTSMNTHFRYQCLFYDWLTIWEEVSSSHGMEWSHVQQVDEKLFNAVRHLETLPIHQKVNVSSMARSLGFSTNHFIHLFRQEYEHTPKAYHMRLRLRQALQLLQTTRSEIKEIANRMGCSHAWFCIWIKRETGKTPSQIRNEIVSDATGLRP